MFNTDKINQSIDLVDVAIKTGAVLKKYGAEWRGTCPVHGGRNPTGFSIYTESGVQKWQCFSGDCGGGDAISFIMKTNNIDFRQACQMIAGKDELVSPAELAKIAEERARRTAEDLQARITEAQRVLDDLRKAEVWKRYHEQLGADEDAQNRWIQRGLPLVWQDVWSLGFDPDHIFYDHIKQQNFHTSTLTIPVFDYGGALVNIRHRLENPPAKDDKYRPEQKGLPASIFIADPDLTPDRQERVVVVEGEIKGMITYMTLDSPGTQVLGVPGMKTNIEAITAKVDRHVDTFICYDPGATGRAEEVARAFTNARVVDLPGKIDDIILMTQPGKKGLERVLEQSRRITKGAKA